ncbi:FadR/GntR family transcriptional regulator [Streptomyces sp. VRA16 Mangrove soil]|uniref:FadR/GntR family transcriptional regulator n=1 Tax=Streptomyces sp. VRA16 Mangrove soil TaxID=2817434 RepID=UPI001A9F2001|nr:FadR/GntR family transcriptional regulator [Streptomyces sp. VRA16 Mangrove soil]MBO1330121.1 FadR family transcriptional regulator [Streptomyces sp. VRA16 Mangrove soil]
MVVGEGTRTGHQQLIDALGRRIVAGDFPVGEPLPVEDRLASQLGVSRGALREAVKALAAKGMLATRPRTGTRVLPADEWNHLDRDVLAWLQECDPRQLLRETGELRRIVEPEAARIAAEHCRPDQLTLLRDALTRMEDAEARGDRAAYVEADTVFHRTLLAAGGNRLLGSLGRAIDVALRHHFAISTQTPGAATSSLPGHRAIVDAVAAGRGADAAAAVTRLISAAERQLADSPGFPAP